MRLFEIPHLVEASAIDIYFTDDSSAHNLLCFRFRHVATIFLILYRKANNVNA